MTSSRFERRRQVRIANRQQGPLTKLGPGKSVNHTERWTLHKNIHIREWTDAELDRVVLPLVGK